MQNEECRMMTAYYCFVCILRSSFIIPRFLLDKCFFLSHINTVLGEINMNMLRDAQDLLSGMSRAEKAQVLQWVVQDLGDAFPGIE
jgi:hypothetical protein